MCNTIHVTRLPSNQLNFLEKNQSAQFTETLNKINNCKIFYFVV